MLFRELNRSQCKTYLVACEETRQAALIDPVRERVDRYLAMLAYFGLRLEYAIDTHTHADHRTGTWELHELVGALVVMHKRAPAPHVTIHVDHGQQLAVGKLVLDVIHTPGHTPDSLSIYVAGHVFTGDTLLIHGTGRADFAGGDAGAQYDSITEKLFRLPDETLVFPAHDYRGHHYSTIGGERTSNPRVAGHSREQYVDLMQGLGLPLPEKIQESLQSNLSAIEDGTVQFPSLAQLHEVRQVAARDVYRRLGQPEAPLVLDVREPEEFNDELGHVAGSVLVPLRELPGRADEFAAFKHRDVVAVCRAGVRSATAAAILTGLGFERVSNLKGGMLDWNEARLPVERM